MARPRAPEREQAKDIWLQSGGKLPLSQLAKEVNVSVGTIRSWKSKDGWVNQLEAQQPKKKRGAPYSFFKTKMPQAGFSPRMRSYFKFVYLIVIPSMSTSK